jgi:hypothetical protein
MPYSVAFVEQIITTILLSLVIQDDEQKKFFKLLCSKGF